MPESLSRAQARRLFVHAQGLDGDWPPLFDGTLSCPQAVARTVTRLGYVQIDTISVVERAHHHTLWLRQPGYTAGDLHAALALDRSVFEAWYPAASYVPMRDYRYALPALRASAERWAAHSSATDLEERHAVLARIRDEGPLTSADFEAPVGFQRGGWWSWKPAKRALEHLLLMGELMVAERRNFQRVYDLRERVLPADVDTSTPTEEELGWFLAEQALASMGVAGEGNTRWHGNYRSALAQGLRDLAEAGLAERVLIEGIPKGAWYVRPQDLAAADVAGRTMVGARLLSPFDNLVINRDWLKALWDFEYSIECYVPRAKRKYGYFSLPVLLADRFVARVDAKADRKSGVLQAIRVILEPGVEAEEAIPAALAGALWELARFCGCSTIDVQAVDPEAFRAKLVAAVEDGEKGE
ncbi:MAG: crosslink repair DNA glycosylase YcaQ family protein [Anaerolineae bacterium]